MSNKSAMFSQRISDLDDQISQASKKINQPQNCLSYMFIGAVLIPVVLGMVLYFLQPGFVQVQDDSGKYVRSGKKVAYWTLLITLIAWVGLYLFTYCQGYTGGGLLCFN